RLGLLGAPALAEEPPVVVQRGRITRRELEGLAEVLLGARRLAEHLVQHAICIVCLRVPGVGGAGLVQLLQRLLVLAAAHVLDGEIEVGDGGVVGGRLGPQVAAGTAAGGGGAARKRQQERKQQCAAC